MVVRHKTSRGSVDGMGDVCHATFYVARPRSWTTKYRSTSKEMRACDIMVSQRCCVLSDVIWTYFCHFLHCSRTKFIKIIVDAWTLVAQQLFAWPRHVLCRTTLLYKVVWLNCCSCGRTFGNSVPVFFITPLTQGYSSSGDSATLRLWNCVTRSHSCAVV